MKQTNQKQIWKALFMLPTSAQWYSQHANNKVCFPQNFSFYLQQMLTYALVNEDEAFIFFFLPDSCRIWLLQQAPL